MIISAQRLRAKATNKIPLLSKGIKTFATPALALKAMNSMMGSVGNHSAFIKSDGPLWVMGSSANGQLGTCGAGLALLPTKLDNDGTYPGKYRLRSTVTTVSKTSRDGLLNPEKDETV